MVTIKRQSGEVVLSTPINEGAKRKFLLMKEDYITLPFSIESPVHFKIGDWVELSNETTSLFEIIDHQHPTFNDNTGGYDYQLQLEAYYMKWKNKIVKYSPQTGGREAAFHLTADPATQLGILLENLKALNYTYRGVDFTFSIDDSVEQSAKLISYNKTNLIDALNLYAQVWECEWWVTNSVIHLGRCEIGSSVDFELHKNVENMSRSDTRQIFATRVYAFGGTRNIPTNYRPTTEQPVVNGIVQKRLMLPIDTPCIDAFPDMKQEEAVEDVVVFDDVYPRRVGTVDAVTTKAYHQKVKTGDEEKIQEWSAYRFKDNGIDFSKKYILQGKELKVVFQSGSLNGMEFAVQFNPDGLNEKSGNEWNAGAQWYEIVRNEDYGRPLPDEVLKPKIGDSYILHGFDIKMVGDLYVPKAEAELKEKAERYVAKSKIDPSVYQCRMMSDTMVDKRGNANLYECGQRVTLINSTYFEEPRPSRIIGYEYNLDIPYDSPIYTVGEVASVGRIGQLEAQIQALTYKGQTYAGMGGGVYLITSIDRTVPSESNAYSARRSHIEFLSRLQPDTATAHLTFADGLTSAKAARLLEGLTTADYVDGLTGRGAKLDANGHAELDSLFVRKFIESSELRYNRVSIVQGEQWHAKGGGIIQSVDMDAKRIQLKLEAGERPTVAVGDLCKANYNTGTGFTTVYFKVTSVSHDGWVTYELRPGYNAHPAPTMHFVAFGNTTDTTRQQSAYSTTGYTRYLRGVNDWEIGVDNIAMQLGDLSNLSVYGLQLEGYSAYLNNVYFTGLIAQIGQAVADKLPRINPATGTWMQWDEQAGRMVDSGIKAKGEDGRQGPQGAKGERGEQGQKGADGRNGIDWGAGKMMYTDPTFVDGDNSVRPYNNANNGMLRVERIPTGEGNPTSSTHMLRVSVTGRTTPGWGGIYFGVVPKHNHVYIIRMLAKVPAGRTLRNPGTRVGNGGSHQWLTPQEGTGKWQEYIYKLTMGDSGVLDSSFYIFLMGGATPSADAPLVWHIASATVYDATDMEAAADAVAEAKAIERYINLVETERAAMEASYAKVYANPLLVGQPKTLLLNANTTYKGAADNLLAAVRTAIAGGRTTPAQKADVDAKYNAYKSALVSLRVAIEEGERAAAHVSTGNVTDLAKYSGKGRMLYTDPMFDQGLNDLYVYPGTDVNQGVTTLERVPKGEGNPYPSTHMVKVTCRGRLIRDWGGFHFARWGTPTKANQILITRIVAKIPVGRRMVFASNSLGDDNSHRWLTSNEGTGKWEEYVYYVFAGTGGRFNTTNYFYLQGGTTPTPENPLVWYVAFATVYDATDIAQEATHLPPTLHDARTIYVGGRGYASVVYDSNNQWYKAVRDVPAGTPLSNRTYWQPISSMGAVGIGEAYARSLWANQAFIDRLHAQSIMARSIKAGDNPDNPQALIDEHGYGHLAGGALRFDAQGLHLGAFDVDNGEIKIIDNEGAVRVRYTNNAVQPLSQIKSESTFSSTIPASEGRQISGPSFRQTGASHNITVWRGEAVLSAPVCTVTQVGTMVELSVRLSTNVYPGDLESCDVALALVSQTGAVYPLGTYGGWEQTHQVRSSGLLPGEYSLRAVFYMEVRTEDAEMDSISTPEATTVLSILSGTAKADPKGYRCIAYHNNGWYIAYPDIMLYMSEEEGFHLTSKNNKLNLPGVLCAARVSGWRTADYAWGRFVKKQGGTAVQVDRERDGSYRVYHSIGHTNYIPTVTPQGGGALMVEMLDVYNDYFTFKFYDRSGRVAASAFNYQCIGSNG